MKSREQKRREAEIRQAEWNKLSIEEKVERLSQRRGESRKQLAKLQHQHKCCGKHGKSCCKHQGCC